MKQRIGREEVLDTCKLLARIYCDNRHKLPKDDKFTLCQAHSILEDIAKTYQVWVDEIEVDLSDEAIEFVSGVGDQQTMFGGK